MFPAKQYLLLLFTWSVQTIDAENSPCPDVFTYEPSGTEADRWYGAISVQTKEDLDGIYLKITLDRPAYVLGNWFAEATSSDNKVFVIKRPDYTLPAGPPISVRFFVVYDVNKPVPRVESIKFNGKSVCSKKGAQTATTSGLFISHSKATTTPRYTTFQPLSISEDNLISSTTTASSNRQKITCGRATVRGTALISNGQTTSKGDWPWHAALFHSESGGFLKYICGGSLISDSHVLTAAHCVTKAKTNRPVQIDILTVYLGKYSLKNFDTSVQSKDISQIFVHPSYNNSYLYNDIAIIKFDEPATFDKYVSPVCFWEDNFSIENKLGTVVGWGYDENNKITDTLMQAQMPVVSTSTCIFSNREFYAQFTNEQTFCAGFRNGTSVCNGDSGGGMVFPKSDTQGQNQIWQIRGIVSVAVARQGQGVCDSNQYIVFTDVAKHLEWIKKIIYT